MARTDNDLPPALVAIIQERAIEATKAYLGSRRTKALPRPASRLTQAEFAVARLMMAGSNGKEIARYLGISPRTVEVHRAHICRKLQVHSVPQAIAVLFLVGLTPDYRAPGAIPADLPKLEDLLP